MEDRHQRLEEHGDAFHSQVYPVLLFGEPIVWVDTDCYLGVTLDKRLTWSSHFDQV